MHSRNRLVVHVPNPRPHTLTIRNDYVQTHKGSHFKRGIGAVPPPLPSFGVAPAEVNVFLLIKA